MLSTDARIVRVLAVETLKIDNVVDALGEKLGTIDDLMVDLDSGCIAYALLSVVGLLGMDDRRFAIPWSAIRVDNKDKQLVLNVNREQLMAAPVFDKDHWPDFGDQVWVEAVHNHYGSKPYWD